MAAGALVEDLREASSSAHSGTGCSLLERPDSAIVACGGVHRMGSHKFENRIIGEN